MKNIVVLADLAIQVFADHRSSVFCEKLIERNFELLETVLRNTISKRLNKI